jgi:hypothetical protein
VPLCTLRFARQLPSVHASPTPDLCHSSARPPLSLLLVHLATCEFGPARKHVVNSDQLLDFLKDALASAADLAEGVSEAPKPKRQRWAATLAGQCCGGPSMHTSGYDGCTWYWLCVCGEGTA